MLHNNPSRYNEKHLSYLSLLKIVQCSPSLISALPPLSRLSLPSLKASGYLISALPSFSEKLAFSPQLFNLIISGGEIKKLKQYVVLSVREKSSI